jgi:hypothetical protein
VTPREAGRFVAQRRDDLFLLHQENAIAFADHHRLAAAIPRSRKVIAEPRISAFSNL